MHTQAADPYRVLSRRETDAGTELLLSDIADEYQPIAVVADPDLGERLEPGHLCTVDVAFDAEPARLVDATVERATVFEFVPDADVVFEAAEEAWMQAEAENEAMNATVTRDTDGEANGVLYVFADGPDVDRLAEFQSGARPLDPLLDRVAGNAGDDPREVFVVSPADEPFAVVYIVLEKDGLLARAMRDTYGLEGAERFDPSAVEGYDPDATQSTPSLDGIGSEFDGLDFD
jgi:hypothetical protein